MENKGFTLIELIATMVILGIIMLIAIPNVIGIIERNNRTAYVEDARKLVTLAEHNFRTDTRIDLNDNQCVVMTLHHLNNGTIDNPPNSGTYVEQNSFVVIRRSGATVYYYVTLVERLPRNRGYNGVRLVSATELRASDANRAGNNPVVEIGMPLPQVPTVGSSNLPGVNCSGGIRYVLN